MTYVFMKTMELLDCALLGVCAVIRSNMVHVCILQRNKKKNLYLAVPLV